VKYIIII